MKSRVRLDLTGQRFGRRVVIGTAQLGRLTWDTLWRYRCDCGVLREVPARNLLRGNSKSCGCYHREAASMRRKTHGWSRTPEYICWCSMKRRCYNTAVKGFEDYGGRGIRVCERWLNSFENFLADMGPKPGPGFMLERNNTNGNYEPDNCCWATRTEQMRNRRNTRYLTVDGQTKTLQEWSELHQISHKTVERRLNGLGWSVKDALTKPLRHTKRSQSHPQAA